MGKITVINKAYTRNLNIESFYVGRPTPLGNPYYMNLEKDRDEVCNLYDDWLCNKLEEHNNSAKIQFNRILQAAKEGDIYLECWCSPKRCHGDTIKRELEKRL